MSRTIDETRVRHIGKLSRIELTDAQVELFGRQLGSILEHFDKLQQLDTDDVEPMPHAVEMHNVLAEDVPGRSLSRDEALANAPQRDEALFAVPRVIGQSQ